MQPDILFIVLDTLRRDRLSSYGHGQATSPAFDAFAAGATLFERAVAPAQWTVPSHASMFTGVYPSTHQVIQSNSQLSPAYPTLASILQANGYHTAGFCNNPLVGVLDNGLSRGFTDFYNYAGAAPNRPHDVTKSRVRRMIADNWRRFAMRVSQRFAQSDWLFRRSLHPLLVPLWTRSINYKGNTENSINDMIDYLDDRRRNHTDTPTFAFLNLMGTHLPYRPPQDYLDRFAPEISKDRAAFRFMNQFNADAARWASPVEEPLSAFENHVIDSFYNAEVAHQDYHLGRLLDHLKASGALENTMVVICADHGEGHGDHNFFGHSFVVYQELVHVPLVIHYPASLSDAFPAGKRITTNISTRRLFHTVLEAADIQQKADTDDHNTDVTALSLARATNGKPDPENGLVFAEAFPPETFVYVLKHRQPQLIDQLSLRQVRRGAYKDAHKLAVVADRVEGLFNVAQDPAETQNIAATQPDRADELQTQIDAFVQNAQAARVDHALAGQISDDMLDNLRALGYIE
jgi:arylsulfatase A-like enzyme